MSVAIIYSGPAKTSLYAASDALIKTLQAEGEAGTVSLSLMTERVKRHSAFGGYEGSNPLDQTAKITLTPFDDWSALPTLFPFAVVSCGGTPGLLLPGQRAHDKQAAGLTAAASTAINGCGATKLWTPSGTNWNIVRTAITKHPTMKLGPGMPLFGGIEITGLADPAMSLGVAGALIDTAAHVDGTGTGTGITESAASDNDAPAFKSSFISGLWTGQWDTASTAFPALMEADGGWELSCDAKYGIVKGAGRTWHMTFEGVEFAIKGKILGASATLMQAACLAYSLGQAVGQTSVPTPPAKSLVLTGPNSKTITLVNCVPMMESSGYQFGGSALTAGEVAFVTSVTCNASTGIPDVVLEFSA
jgi:hypothetical protein